MEMKLREGNETIEALAKQVVDAIFTVHATLGPGLFESVYLKCLEHEIASRGLQVERHVYLPIRYRDLEIPNAFQMDLLVEKKIIIEVKAVEKIERVHIAQLLNYLNLSELRLGFIANFNVALIKDGIRRVVL